MQLILISGLSGSGKSVALNVMEDCGHCVVDNLPSALLPQLVTHLRGSGYQRIAVAVDVSARRRHRCTAPADRIPARHDRRRALPVPGCATTPSSPGSPKPAASIRWATTTCDLAEAIAREREALALISEPGHRIDTSDLSANTLRNWVKRFMRLEAGDPDHPAVPVLRFQARHPDGRRPGVRRAVLPTRYDPVLRPHRARPAGDRLPRAGA